MNYWRPVCLACCFAFAVSRATFAGGIEAAASAEELIQSCRGKAILSRPDCLNDSLNRKWKYELEYAGKQFSAIGRLEMVRRSFVGNFFAFMIVGDYRVACKVTKKSADELDSIGHDGKVLISGVLESYHITFNLHRLHHLRLTPYCSIEAVA